MFFLSSSTLFLYTVKMNSSGSMNSVNDGEFGISTNSTNMTNFKSKIFVA